MKKTMKVFSAFLATVSALGCSVGMYAQATDVAPLDARNIPVIWRDEYANGKIISSVGETYESLIGEPVNKELDHMTVSYIHTTAATPDDQVMVQNAMNYSGSTRYMNCSVYISNSNMVPLYSFYEYSAGSIAANSPCTTVLSVSLEELADYESLSEVYYVDYNATLYAGNTHYAPTENDVQLRELLLQD